MIGTRSSAKHREIPQFLTDKSDAKLARGIAENLMLTDCTL